MSERSVPSRDFMIRQAVLDACTTFDGGFIASIAKREGNYRALSCVTSDDYVNDRFVACVRAHFFVWCETNGLEVIPMSDTVSPYVAEAARRAGITKPTFPKSCPWCRTDPGLTHQTWAGGVARYQVGCEDDECPVNPQTSAYTLEDAWARWNMRASK